jgi:hypothetical protein
LLNAAAQKPLSGAGQMRGKAASLTKGLSMKNLRIFFLFALAGACFGQARDAEFNKLADRFFGELMFRFNPVAGTAAGFH